jgi:hypothetical protein
VSSLFVLVGALCLLVALVQAWLLVAVFSSETSPVSRLIPGRQDLLKSHIDYLMMAQFLFIFFMLAKALAVALPVWVVVSASIGAFFNPFAFFVRAVKPSYLKHAPLPFTLMITVSCILTTVGFAATAWLFASAVAWPSL